MSYPALLAIGLPALAANVANNVALVACWPGSALASRRELHGQAPWLRRWTLATAVGAAAGAATLLLTPAGAFAHIVPFLVVAGSLALALEPRLTAWHARGGEGGRQLGLGLVVVAFYNGYFGAGAGVMTLTLVLVLVQPHLPTANALKNMLIGAACLASAAVLVIAGPVRWSAVIPLAIGMLFGANLGPRVARRVPRPLLRWVIVALGLALAVELWFNP